MSKADSTVKYCLDSSALLELRSLDKDVFPGVWDALDELAAKGVIHAPHEVLREVTHYDTATAAWAKSRKHIFFDPDQPLLEKVIEVQSVFQFFDPDSEDPKADPFLVAHASLTGCTVVTQETPTNKKNKPKIPDACDHFKCRVISISEFFREQGWTFVAQKNKRS